MVEKEALDNQMKPEKKKSLIGWLVGGALLVALMVFWFISAGEKASVVKPEPPIVAQESVVTPPPAAKTPVVKESKPAKPASAAPAVIPNVAKAPEVQQPQPANQPPPSLGMNLNEFCQRFNLNSEKVKSKLRINNFTLESGAVQDAYRHDFNENLYFVGSVNKSDGALAEINLVGVLNGSLATAVDLNQSIGSIITAFIPGLNQEGREAILNALGVNKITSGIFNLEEQVTRNGVTYWVKSSRKEGLHFGVIKAR